MAPKQPLKPATPRSASPARNDAEDNDKPPGHQSKQPKINAFFMPRVSLSTIYGTDKTTSVAKLSEEQYGVLQHVAEEGKSVFFTGSAVDVDTGTGKSLLLRAIISALGLTQCLDPVGNR